MNLALYKRLKSSTLFSMEWVYIWDVWKYNITQKYIINFVFWRIWMVKSSQDTKYQNWYKVLLAKIILSEFSHNDICHMERGDFLGPYYWICLSVFLTSLSASFYGNPSLNCPAVLQDGLTDLFREIHQQHKGDPSVGLPLYLSVLSTAGACQRLWRTHTNSLWNNTLHKYKTVTGWGSRIASDSIWLQKHVQSNTQTRSNPQEKYSVWIQCSSYPTGVC